MLGKNVHIQREALWIPCTWCHQESGATLYNSEYCSFNWPCSASGDWPSFVYIVKMTSRQIWKTQLNADLVFRKCKQWKYVYILIWFHPFVIPYTAELREWEGEAAQWDNQLCCIATSVQKDSQSRMRVELIRLLLLLSRSSHRQREGNNLSMLLICSRGA